MRGIGREILRLERIVYEIVELPLLRLFEEVNELPSTGSNAAMLFRAMAGRILEVLVEECIAPGHLCAEQERQHAAAVKAEGHGYAGELQQRRRDIHIEDHVLAIH